MEGEKVLKGAIQEIGKITAAGTVKQTKLTSFMKKDKETHYKDDNKIMSTIERRKRVTAETKRWESSKLVTSILRELAGEVPGRAAASSVVMKVIDMAWNSGTGWKRSGGQVWWSTPGR